MWNALDRPVEDLDIARVTARDELVTAERALATCEAAVVEREAELVALDGVFTSAWMTLTGTKSRAVDEAAARILEARRRVTAARANLEKARARVAEIDADADARADAARREDAEHEAAFAALAASDHPLAGDLRAVRLERELLQDRFRAVEEAAYAGSDLIAALATVSRSTDAIRSTTSLHSHGPYAAHGAVGEIFRDELSRAGSYSYIQTAVADTPARLHRFRTAMEALGRQLELQPPTQTGTVSPLESMLRNGLGELALLERTEALATEYLDLESDARELMTAIDRELRELRTAVPELLARERQLVRDASPAAPGRGASTGTSGDRS